MDILSFTVTDDTCVIIGEFAIAWGFFEYKYFDKVYKIEKLSKIEIVNLNEEIKKTVVGVKKSLLDFSEQNYGSNFCWADKLRVKKESNREIVNQFLADTETIDNEQVKNCIFVCSRIRNNLFHGEKDIAMLNEQKQIIESVKEFLKILIEVDAIILTKT